MGLQPLEKAKPKYKKGLWSPEEDNKLKNHIVKHGHGCWSSVPIKAGLQRNGKSCRLRWINYLRPGLKRGLFSKQEEETILTLHQMLGNNFTNEACQSSPIPKLLFAEWLTLDHVQCGGNSANSYDESLALKNGFDSQISSFQESATVHDPMSQGPFGGDYHNNSLAHSSAEEMFNSQLKFGTTMVENGFIQCIPGVEFSANFNMSNDTMYIYDNSIISTAAQNGM
ncbi:hypothetical protein AHAS_Ahas19G0323700 [Arachis hypogaea]